MEEESVLLMESCVYEEKRNSMRTKTGELNEPYLSRRVEQ
jgi:hypothetical protein